MASCSLDPNGNTDREMAFEDDPGLILNQDVVPVFNQIGNIYHRTHARALGIV